METEDYGYKVIELELDDLPEEFDKALFHSGVWLVKLHGLPQAYCVSKNFADAIRTLNLARPPSNHSNTQWVDYCRNSMFLAKCTSQNHRVIKSYFEGSFS